MEQEETGTKLFTQQIREYLAKPILPQHILMAEELRCGIRSYGNLATNDNMWESRSTVLALGRHESAADVRQRLLMAVGRSGISLNALRDTVNDRPFNMDQSPLTTIQEQRYRTDVMLARMRMSFPLADLVEIIDTRIINPYY